MAVFPATEQAGIPGAVGFELITDTAAHSGRFFRLYALEATVINTATVQNASGNTFSAVPIPAGGAIDGTFTSVTLTSGKVVAYKV
jgi:hypothetical protein